MSRKSRANKAKPLSTSPKKPTLRKLIIEKLALGRRGTCDGEQICLTPDMLAFCLKKKTKWVSFKLNEMAKGGLVCQPFPGDDRFFCLTLKGQRGQPMKFAT